MTISELAHRTGLPPETLRFYDRSGLLPSRRRSNGYREFDESCLQVLAFVQLGIRLGFTLREIRPEVQAVFFQPFEYERVKGLLETQLNRLRRRQAELVAAEQQILELMATCDRRPDSRAPGLDFPVQTPYFLDKESLCPQPT